MKATLGNPVAVNPAQIASVRLVSATLLFGSNGLQIAYECLDAGGAVIDRKNVSVATAASQTYVSAQEQVLLQKLMTKLGFTATIA